MDLSEPKQQLPRTETYDQLFANPLSKGTSFGNIRIVLDSLANKFRDLHTKKEKDFKLRVFKVKKDIFFQVLVPSETVDKLTYDVVIKFIGGADRTNLSGTPVQVFSNSPSFVYTYAYAFNNANLLVTELKNKMHSESINTIPKVRNTELVTGFEKTIFYAYFYIQNFNATNKEFFGKMLLNTNIGTVARLVKTTDEKQVEYNKLKKLSKVSKAPVKKIKLEPKKNSKIKKINI